MSSLYQIMAKLVGTGAVRPGDAQELTEERRNASFDPEHLTNHVYRGAKTVRRRREIAAYVEAHPELHDVKPKPFMTRLEKMDNAYRKAHALRKVIDDIVDASSYEENSFLDMSVFGTDSSPFGLHKVMFLPALLGQANDEQKELWLGKALNYEILGTYAQTELGHGTNLKKLETLARYVPETDEFELHSPTMTSMKWWPGALGKTSNHAVVVAQLYIAEKLYGPHLFIVQLRDLETHRVMPGISLGDIGPKFAFSQQDNGFLRLDHVRIPRTQMLMQHAQVAKGGAYSRPAHDKLGYGTMVFVRTYMISNFGFGLANAVTVAVRYSAIRRQGEIEEGKGKEVKIIEYQTQQHRLFPHIARAYAYLATGYTTRQLYSACVENLKQGNTELLAELHALTSGLKAVVTFETTLAMEQCRMSCGGHGYSAASALPDMTATFVAGCTYEGENMVLLLQCARFLHKAVAKIRKTGQSPSTITAYLAKKDETRTSLFDRAPGDVKESLLAALEHAARRTVFSAADRLNRLVQEGLSAPLAWNQNAVENTRAARLHTRYFIARCFVDSAREVVDHAAREALTKLVELYLAYEVTDVSSHLLADGFFSGDQLTVVKELLYTRLAQLRRDAVALVDAFDVPDRILQSELGRRDGHVYEGLVRWATQDNPLSHKENEVLPGFAKYLKPIMEEGAQKSKL